MARERPYCLSTSKLEYHPRALVHCTVWTKYKEVNAYFVTIKRNEAQVIGNSGCKCKPYCSLAFSFLRLINQGIQCYSCWHLPDIKPKDSNLSKDLQDPCKHLSIPVESCVIKATYLIPNKETLVLTVILASIRGKRATPSKVDLKIHFIIEQIFHKQNLCFHIWKLNKY